MRKVVHWTNDEHMRFLKGLLHGYKGNWKDISQKYVVTKTPTQVASHAQKYYKRQEQKFDDKSKDIKRKPRTSIHDTTTIGFIMGISYTPSNDQVIQVNNDFNKEYDREQVIQVNNDNNVSSSSEFHNIEWDIDDIVITEEDLSIIFDMPNEDGSLASATFNKECDREQVIQVNNDNNASSSSEIDDIEWDLDDIVSEDDLSTINDMLNEDGSLASATFNK
ncbi:transcription factor DIVARICATA [Trifolium repens]|nr:transcription factor DIVARICATA [Trifolium repens]